MSSIFDGLTFTMEEAEQAIEDGKRKRERSDPRICVCGHNARSHTSEAVNNPTHASWRAQGKFYCVPGKQECPCKKFVPVLTSSDPRKFIYKTDGPGARHALAKGIAAAQKVERIKLQWTEGAVCERCKRSASEVRLTPVALGHDLFESSEPTIYNTLLCDDDRRAVYDMAVEEFNQRIKARSQNSE
jgi:hypothetical protein